jgi:SAM-dependent methyltransferase
VDLDENLRPDPNLGVVCATGEALPFLDRSFDVVYCRSVMEHVRDPRTMFREISRVLRPGGLFLLLTPNRWDYVSIAAAVIPNRFHQALVRRLTGRPDEETFPTLYRANTTSRLRAIAGECGLTVQKLELRRQHPHYLQSSGALYLAGVIFEQCVQRPIPWLRPWILGVFQSPLSDVARQLR